MKTALFILLTILLFGCGSANDNKPVESHQPKVVVAKGYTVPKDSLHTPAVVPINFRDLERKIAGAPTVMPANVNVFPVGLLPQEKAGRPDIVTPGRGAFDAPRVVPAKGNPTIVKLSKPVTALPMRMKDAADCNIQYLDVDQGMNSSYVRSIFEDRAGNMWFGTDGGGVSRYDGRTFIHFTNAEGLGNNTVRCIFEDEAGNKWFGTDRGVTRYDGHTLTHFLADDGFSDGTVYEIVEDRDGQLWFATGSGAIVFDGATFSHYGEKQGLSTDVVNSVTKDSRGDIWLGTGDGVCRFDGKSFHKYLDKQGLTKSYVLSVLGDRQGNLWIGSDEGVSKFDGSTFSYFTEKEGVPNSQFRSIAEDLSGNIWFASDGGGAIVYDGKSCTRLTEANGLSNNTVLSIVSDESGNIWMGTDGGGVSIYNPKSFVHYTEKNGLNSSYILAMLEDKHGNLWFGSYEAGVCKYDGKSFTCYTEDEGLVDNTVRAIFEDKNGNLWFGTNGGVSKFDGKTFTNYRQSDGLFSRYIRSIAADKWGNLWFGMFDDGADKFDGKSFTHYSTNEGLSGNSIWCVRKDKSGKLWFATDKGLTCYDGSTFTHFAGNEGLTDRDVWTIYEDRRGNLWFGTDGGGLSKYDGKSFTHFTNREGVCRNFVFCIAEDRKGNLWAGTDKGVACLPLTYLESPSNQQVINFHKEDGLKAEDFFQSATMVDRKNRLWLGSGKALTMVDLKKMELVGQVPGIQLDQVFLEENYVDYHSARKDGGRLAGSGQNEVKNIYFRTAVGFHNYPNGLELPYNVNHVTFQFSAIDWYAPHKLTYQYKIEGLDEDWSNLTPDNKADYRNIPNGNYTFKVKAIGSAGKWSSTIAYPFIVHPPWWRTWWAYTIYALLTVLGIVVIVRWNSNMLRKRAIVLKVKVAEATQEIKEQKAVVEHQKQAIEERHKEITDSINYAERIQRSLLASQKLLDENLAEYFILFKPKDVVSGDFYWATKLDNGNFALMCGDSTGHGVPGAIMSILNIACLEKAVEVEKLRQPDEILNYTRYKIIETLKNDGSAEGGKDGMDGTLLSFDFTTNILHFASANNPVWLVRGDEFIEVKPDRFPIGKYEKECEPFTLQMMQLQKGDVLYALTDGFSDQFGGPEQDRGGKKFTQKKLRELLLGFSKEPMGTQKERLNEIFEGWKGTLEQVDDVTVIGVRV